MKRKSKEKAWYDKVVVEPTLKIPSTEGKVPLKIDKNTTVFVPVGTDMEEARIKFRKQYGFDND